MQTDTRTSCSRLSRKYLQLLKLLRGVGQANFQIMFLIFQFSFAAATVLEPHQQLLLSGTPSFIFFIRTRAKFSKLLSRNFQTVIQVDYLQQKEIRRIDWNRIKKHPRISSPVSSLDATAVVFALSLRSR